jgi:hypothetical protein
MPELPVKDVRFSDLHLPELKRDGIMRALSDIRRPDVDLSKIERPKLSMPESVSNIDWPSTSDIGKAVAGAAAAAHIGRRASRPRWPFAVGGLIVAGLAAWALSNEMVRARISEAVEAVRGRIAAMRMTDDDRFDDDPIAFDAAETHPIEAPPYSESSTVDATAYPDGLGSNNGDGIPAYEESVTRD